MSQLKLFAPTLLNTHYARLTIELITTTFSLKYSTYNLIKYELVEFLARLNYCLINYVIKTNSVQDYVINEIFVVFLSNNDNKLRRHTAKMMALLIRNLYSFDDNLDVLPKLQYINKFDEREAHVSNDSNKNSKYAKPFEYLLKSVPKSRINIGVKSSINFILPLLIQRLLATQNKYETYGILECLDCISEIYEPYLFLSSNALSDLLSTIMMFTSHPLVLMDLYVHNIVLKLINSIYTACFSKHLNDLDVGQFMTSSSPSHQTKWRFAINNCFLANVLEKVFSHVIKLLAIIANCVDSQSHATGDPNSIGNFANNQIYTKLRDLLKKSFSSYKKLLTPQNNDDKFFAILKTVLGLFQNIFESSIDTSDCINHVDEILGYLKIIIKINFADAIKCVTTLIRALFGKNFTNTYLSAKSKISNQKAHDTDHGHSLKRNNIFVSSIKSSANDYNQFVGNLRQNKYINLNIADYANDELATMSTTINTKTLAKASNPNQQNFIMNLLRTNKTQNVTNALPVVQQKIDNKFISQHIRSFETIVIISLRQYTTTSFITLQYNILDLLNELLLLKVNYTLLDSEYVFIDYILKQLDYLEQQQTRYVSNDYTRPRETETEVQTSSKKSGVLVEHKMFFILLPKIYEFLINLTFEFTQNQKLNIINIPKLIHISNNLLASENSPDTHVIPALAKLIKNTRLLKLSNDIQHDMLIQTCLKLISYPQVWPLLSILLKHVKDGSNVDKYNKLSRNTFDTLFAALNNNQLRFGLKLSRQINIRHLLLLLSTLSSQVYRPVDIILNSYVQFRHETKRTEFVIYLTHVYLLLVFSNNEEVLLCRLQKYMGANSDQEASMVFIDGLFDKLVTAVTCSLEENYSLLVDYTLLLIHVVNGGYFKDLKSHMKDYVTGERNDKIDQLNKLMIKNVAPRFCLLAYYWQYFLILCNYNNNKYWSFILTSVNTNENVKDFQCLDWKLFEMVTLMLYCDYINNTMNENGSGDTIESLLLILFNFNNISYLFELYNQEACVVDIISKIHRKQSLSVLYLQTITQNFSYFFSSSNNCISNMHMCLKTVEVNGFF